MRKRHQNPEFKCSGFTVLSFRRKTPKHERTSCYQWFHEKTKRSSFQGKPVVSICSVCTVRNEAFDADPEALQRSLPTQTSAFVTCKLPALGPRWPITLARHWHNGWRKKFCNCLCDLSNSVDLYILVYRRFLLAKGSFGLWPSICLS